MFVAGWADVVDDVMDKLSLTLGSSIPATTAAPSMK